MSAEEYEKALTLAIDGCKQVHAMQREALRKKYATEQEEVQKEVETEETNE